MAVLNFECLVFNLGTVGVSHVRLFSVLGGMWRFDTAGLGEKQKIAAVHGCEKSISIEWRYQPHVRK